MAIGLTNKPYQEMINNFQKEITYTPVTKTTDNISGDETLTEGTSSTIKGAFYREEDVYSQEFAGLFQGADAILIILPNITVNKNDLITYDSEEYRCDKITTRRLKNIEFYKVARCFLND